MDDAELRLIVKGDEVRSSLMGDAELRLVVKGDEG